MHRRIFFYVLSVVLMNGCDDPARVQQQPISAAKPRLHPVHLLTVAEVDEQKNSIPTGTELTVQGMMYNETWTPVDECTWLLAGHPLRIQHGETDPREYCRFSILLSKVYPNRSAAWPGVSLVCNATVEEVRRAARMYPYGTSVQAHGAYAASLDFGVVPFPGNRFGVPVLDQCTLRAVSNSDKAAEQVYDLMDKDYRDHPAADQPYNY